MTTRWPTIIIALLLLLLSPLFLVLIFLSGDSCCGENTSAAMTGAAVFSLIFVFGGACLLHGLWKSMRHRGDAHYGVISRALLSSVPSLVLYSGFLLALTAQWIF